MHRLPIKLVDGGEQKRSFTYIDDAIDCILRILENTDGVATRRIFNIGNPGNCVSVAELARRIVRIAARVSATRRARPGHQHRCPSPRSSTTAMGYQDIQVRVPAVDAAREHLGWSPTTDLDSRDPKDHCLLCRAGHGGGSGAQRIEEVDANGVARCRLALTFARSPRACGSFWRSRGSRRWRGGRCSSRTRAVTPKFRGRWRSRAIGSRRA